MLDPSKVISLSSQLCSVALKSLNNTIRYRLLLTMRAFQIEFQIHNKILKLIFCLARRYLEFDKAACFVDNSDLKLIQFGCYDLSNDFQGKGAFIV